MEQILDLTPSAVTLPVAKQLKRFQAGLDSKIFNTKIFRSQLNIFNINNKTNQ